MKSDYQLLSRVVAVKAFGKAIRRVRDGEDAIANSPRRVPPDPVRGSGSACRLQLYTDRRSQLLIPVASAEDAAWVEALAME